MTRDAASGSGSASASGPMSANGGRPSSFERDQLIAAARELGPDNLALRAVADALAVPRTTVYNHVRSPEELGSAVLTALLTTGEHTAPGGEQHDQPWPAQLEAYALHQRDRLVAAGPWLRFYRPDVHLRTDGWREADRLIGLLVRQGFATGDAGRALAMITSLVNEAVRIHASGLGAPTELGTHLTRLRAEGLTHIAAALDGDAGDRDEEQFRYNLRCAIKGIAQQVSD